MYYFNQHCVSVRLHLFNSLLKLIMSSLRVKCPECTKSYVNTVSLKRYLVSAHQFHLDLCTNSIRALSGSKLGESMKKLRRQQYSGTDRASFQSSAVAGRKRRRYFSSFHHQMCNTRVSTDSKPQGDASGSVNQAALIATHPDTPSPLMPALRPEPPVNLSSAQWDLPEILSTHTDDIDVTVFDQTLSGSASASTSIVSLPSLTMSEDGVSVLPSRTSTPVEGTQTGIVPQTGIVLETSIAPEIGTEPITGYAASTGSSSSDPVL